MSRPVLVAPFREDLLPRLQARTSVLRVRDAQEIPQALQAVHHHHIPLYCLWVETSRPLAAVPFRAEWKDTPLAVSAPSLGIFRDVMGLLPLLRTLNVRIFLPADSKENFAGLRLLSSLGVECAAVFPVVSCDWERISDLMTYALLNHVSHAPLEPFHHIASHYHPNKATDFGVVYFEEASRYLHLDEEGRPALTRDDLQKGRFIARDVLALSDAEWEAAVDEHKARWTDHFLKTDGCAYCPGWRVCLGKFAATARESPGCRDFFSELMEVAEQYQSRQPRKQDAWQP